MQNYQIIDEEEFQRKNLSNVDLNMVKYIDGAPFVYVINSPYFDCNILMFGDIHRYTKNGFGSNVDNSLYIPYYLDALFKKYPNKQFDVLTETAYVKHGNESKVNNETYKGTSGLLHNIRIQFKECFKGINHKTQCNKSYPNVRFHSGDIRMGVYEEYRRFNKKFEKGKKNIRQKNINNIMNKLNPWMNNEENLIYEVYNTLGECNKYPDVNDKFECRKKLIQNMYEKLAVYKSDFGDMIFNLLESDNSKFSRYRTIPGYEDVRNFAVSQLNLMNFIYNPSDLILQLLQREKLPTSIEVYNLIQKYGDLLLSTGSIIYDYYNLIRCLKIKQYGGKNIIMIAGDYHVMNILNFIKDFDSQHKVIFSNKNYLDNNSLLITCIKSYENIMQPNYMNQFLNNWVSNNESQQNFSLQYFNLRADIIIDLLDKMQFNLLKLQKPNNKIFELIKSINILIKIYQILDTTNKHNNCHSNIDPEIYIKQTYRKVKIDSSLIEQNLL